MLRLLLILIISILALLYSKSGVRVSYEIRRKRFIWSVIILLILQSGLRNWAVGSDTYQYYRTFDTVRHTQWDVLIDSFVNREGKDPFYGLFQKTFQVFSDSYQLYLVLVAVIFMLALGNFIIKNTTQIRHALLAFVVYMGNFYGFFSITGIRQTIATALLLWSFEYIKKRKLIFFTILVVIASLFHISALVFFPLYFIAEIRRPRLVFGLALFSFPLVMLFKNPLALFLVSFAGAEERFGTFAQQYEKGGSFVLTALHVLLGIWALFLANKVIKIAPLTYRMYNVFAVALFFFPLQWVNPNAARISQYFTVIIMVWIPFLLDAASIGKPKQRELLYLICIIAFIAFTSFAITLNEYAFFWQDMEFLPDAN